MATATGCAAKRLAEGRFLPPPIQRSDGRATAVELSETEWHLLLDGIVVRDRVLLKRHRRSLAEDQVRVPALMRVTHRIHSRISRGARKFCASDVRAPVEAHVVNGPASPTPRDEADALRRQLDAMERAHQAKEAAWNEERTALVARIHQLIHILEGRAPKAAPSLLTKPVDAGATPAEAESRQEQRERRERERLEKATAKHAQGQGEGWEDQAGQRRWSHRREPTAADP